MSYADAGSSHGDHGAGFKVLTTLFQHVDQKIRELFGFQPFDADANHGGPRRARKGLLGMKIRVQSNDDLRMVSSSRGWCHRRQRQGQLRRRGRLLGPRPANEAWWSAAGPGREGASGGNDRGKDFVVEGSGGEGERLANIFVFEFRVLALELGTVGISCQGFKYTANCQAHVANARLAVHAGRVGRDAV